MSASRRSPGRPREFDEAKALDGAIAAFSASGFSGTSISDLTEAAGLSAGSLYKAYGDKEGVYSSALDRYLLIREAGIAEVLASARNGREGIMQFIGLYADLSLGHTGRQGCMVVAGIAELDHVIGSAMTLRMALARRHDVLAQLIADGQRDGSVATKEKPEQIADLLLALLQGMRVVGKSGNFPADADTFVRLALKLLD